MPSPTEASLRDALRAIADPADATRDIVAAGLLEAIEIREGRDGSLVRASLITDRHRAPAMEPVRRAAEQALARQHGVVDATVVLTSHRPAPPAAPAAPERPKLLAQAGAVIAIASGKGGVGKSTVAVNLSVALARAGRSVGLLDADIHGPSLPMMLGIHGRPEVRDGRMVPALAHGVRVLSIGMLVDPEQAMIWRGPMVMGALTQLMEQAEWGAPDVMLIDLPPGTGDVALTLAQKAALTGAVIVSTPQDVALADARRGVAMFRRVAVPVLGLIENMSFFCCPNCNHRTEIFGHGGARAEAEALGIPFLGEIPLLAAIRAAGDAGMPLATGGAAEAFANIAAGLVTFPHRHGTGVSSSSPG